MAPSSAAYVQIPRSSSDADLEAQTLLGSQNPTTLQSWSIKLTNFFRLLTLTLYPIVFASLIGRLRNSTIFTIVFLCISLGYNLFIIFCRILANYVTVSFHWSSETTKARTRPRRSKVWTKMSFDLLCGSFVFVGMLIVLTTTRWRGPGSIIVDLFGFAICTIHFVCVGLGYLQRDIRITFASISTVIALPQDETAEAITNVKQ